MKPNPLFYPTDPEPDNNLYEGTNWQALVAFLKALGLIALFWGLVALVAIGLDVIF